MISDVNESNTTTTEHYFESVDEELQKTARKKSDSQFVVYEEYDLQHDNRTMLISANTHKEVKKETDSKQGFFSKVLGAFKRDKTHS